MSAAQPSQQASLKRALLRLNLPGLLTQGRPRGRVHMLTSGGLISGDVDDDHTSRLAELEAGVIDALENSGEFASVSQDVLLLRNVTIRGPQNWLVTLEAMWIDPAQVIGLTYGDGLEALLLGDSSPG